MVGRSVQFAASLGTMKTVIVLAGLIALALAKSVHFHHGVETKNVDNVFVQRQKKILELFENVEQVNEKAEYYKVGKDYDVEANIQHYTNQVAIQEYLTLYRTGFLPKYYEFSIFHKKIRDETMAIFNMFYYAKDFDTFYKSAAFARVHFNAFQFAYTFYIAVLQREDTRGFVLPAPYEVYPHFFVNFDTQIKAFETKMVDGLFDSAKLESQYGIFVDDDAFVYYSNYSNGLSYPDDEQRLSYLTEDIGWNSHYYYFHSNMPFWWNADKFGALKERRGEIYYYFYQQLLSRYYLERLTNGLDEIPQFSWYSPIKTGYYPHLYSSAYPFAQRNEYYDMHTPVNFEKVRFLDTYEKTFVQFLQRGHFKAYNRDIDFHEAKAVNFVGNYWQANADLFEMNVTQDYQRSYEIIARHVLGAAPKPFDKYTFMPSALDFYQTSLRDPAFYQLYNRIVDYIVQFKEYLKPYEKEEIHFTGVKVNDVKVEKMTTFFEYYDFDASNMVMFNQQELTSYPKTFVVRQPRLNHKPFTVAIDIKSDVNTDAVVKIFLGPKYDSEGYPITLETSWMKFFELDWYTTKLTTGQNTIVRNSQNFTIFKDDSLPISEIKKILEQGKVPHDMADIYSQLPRRLMLPKGTYGGFPFQLFVFVYPFTAGSSHLDNFEALVLDNKPFGFPLDRPVREPFFKQPNMFFKDVSIYHEGESFAYKYNVPSEITHSNMVPKA